MLKIQYHNVVIMYNAFYYSVSMHQEPVLLMIAKKGRLTCHKISWTELLNSFLCERNRTEEKAYQAPRVQLVDNFSP